MACIKVLRIFKQILSSVIVGGFVASALPVAADVWRLETSLSSGHTLRNLEVNGSGPKAAVGLDWTGDNGLYAGGECLRTDLPEKSPARHACIGYVGYFYALNGQQALSLQASRSFYNQRALHDWSSNEATLTWHYGASLMVSASYSDEWLGQRTAITGLDLSYSYPLNDRFAITTDLGVIRPQNNSVFDDVRTASVGIEFRHERWSTNIKTRFYDADSVSLLPFRVSEPELSWAVSYQLY